MSAPQSILRSDEDGRTHRSAPTKGYTYHRYTSSASVVDKARRVTRCRDARSERPLYQKLQHRSFNDNGRTDRASLQGDVSLIFVPLWGRGVGRPLIHSYCIGLLVMLLHFTDLVNVLIPRIVMDDSLPPSKSRSISCRPPLLRSLRPSVCLGCLNA